MVPALVLGATGIVQMLGLFSVETPPTPELLALADFGILLLPWLGLLAWRHWRSDLAPINEIWRYFRDRYGLFWGQRIREQYNTSARHEGLPGYLYWRGWKAGPVDALPTPIDDLRMQALMTALVQRFEAQRT